MTPLQQQKVQALREAHRYVSNGRAHFVCIALGFVAEKNASLQTAAEELGQYIRRSLGNSMTLENWQSKKGIRTRLSMKQARLKWIDWMIECLEAA